MSAENFVVMLWCLSQVSIPIPHLVHSNYVAIYHFINVCRGLSGFCICQSGAALRLRQHQKRLATNRCGLRVNFPYFYYPPNFRHPSLIAV